jgi:hypothetical protein
MSISTTSGASRPTADRSPTSRQSNEANEDFAAAAANGAVLLDGAGLSGTATQCVHGVLRGTPGTSAAPCLRQQR